MTRTPRAPRLRVPVTREIIKDGIQRDSTHCVVAEAVKAIYPDASRVAVDLQTIRFSDLKKGLRFTYLTPRITQVALVNYDQGTEPEPFEFSLKSGQVTLAGKRSRSEKTLTNAQMKQRENAAVKNRERLKKARLVNRNKTPGGTAEVAGGKPPPVVPGGARRAFGLRGLER